MRKFLICISVKTLFGWRDKKKDENFQTCGTKGAEMNTGFWCGDLRERDNLEDPDVDCRIMLK